MMDRRLWTGTVLAGLLLALGCEEPRVVGPAVSPLPPAPLVITPAKATLTTGQGTDFAAKGEDGSRPTITWSASGGAVDPSGHFTAPAEPGAVQVQARALGREAAAQVTVVAPPTGPITAPEHILAGDRDIQVSVPVQAGAGYTWRIEGGTLAGEASGPTAAFVAGTGEKVTLACRVVNAAGLAKTFSLEIPLVSRPTLVITPATATLTAGRTRIFGFDLQGGRTGQVIWSVLEPGGGTVDASGAYHAPQVPGNYTVQVASQEATLPVKVVAAPIGPVKGPAHATAGQTGLGARVPDQPGCTYLWKLTGATLTSGQGLPEVVFEAGDGPELKLACTITNEANESLEASLTIPVAAPAKAE